MLHVLVLADCSARAAQEIREPLLGRRAQRVDVDRLDAVIRGWNAHVPLLGSLTSGKARFVEPRSIEELHPDNLLEELDDLAELLALRDQSEHTPGAAKRLAQLLARAALEAGEDVPRPSPAVAATAHAAAPVPAPAPAPVQARSETPEDTLSRLLGGSRASGSVPAAPVPTPPQSAASAAPGSNLDINQFIRSIVAGHLTPQAEAPAEERALAAVADEELSRRLRGILRDPTWRALEAAWRGIDGLCRNCPDEERIALSVLDVSFEELARDTGALARLLAAEATHVLVLDHQFGASSAELEVLAGLLESCHAEGVSLLAGAGAELAGCVSFAETPNPEEQEHAPSDDVRAAWARVLAWRERGARLGLALPRFLLRQPYGAAGEPLERLVFEEVPDPADHEAFSWGNGVYLLARALCIQHADAPGIRPDGTVDVREVPVVYLETAEENRVKPSAEAWLSERAVGRLTGSGFCVLQAVRDTDRIVVHPVPAVSRV